MMNKKTPIPLLPMIRTPIPERKYTRGEILDMEAGRSPPQAEELEQVILGAMMIDKKGVDEAIDILKPEFFFNEYNGIIFQAIQNLYESMIGIDLLTVSTELKRIGKLALVGGDFYLIALTQKVSSSAHIEFHSRIVIQKYVLRRLIDRAHETMDQSFYRDPDIFELMEDIEIDIAGISQHVIKATGVVVSNAKEELYEKMKAIERGEAPGIGTGIHEFDDWCGGFRKRELITIAARTGMGKTTALLSIAHNIAFQQNIEIAFFSLEMAVTDLKNRLAAKGTGISYDKIRDGKLTAIEYSKIIHYYDVIDESKLHLIDKINVHEKIIKKIRELVTKFGIKIVMIDYVQLMKLARKTSDKTGDLTDITRDLKALANELNIPIIIVAQLNRDVDKRPNHRPLLIDLKMSGSIEEDSDTVIFILRPAYYIQSTGELIPPHIIGKTEWIVAKGRNTGTRDFWTFLDFINYDFRTY